MGGSKSSGSPSDGPQDGQTDLSPGTANEDPPEGQPGLPPATDTNPVPLQTCSTCCTQKVQHTPASPIPATVNADSVIEFVNNYEPALGGHAHCELDVEKTDWDTQGGKISSVTIKIKTAIVRPRWGGGRASDKDRVLITKAVELIKGHEERHRALALERLQTALCAALGQSEAKGKKIIEKGIDEALHKVQDELDAKEGGIAVVMNAGNTEAVDVQLVPKKKTKTP